MCITKECADPTSVGVWWRDDAEWCRYDTASAEAILLALVKGQENVDLKSIASAVHTYGASYTVDLQRMLQSNKASRHTRAVKVILPATATATATIFSYGGLTDYSYGFLFSLIDEIREEKRVVDKVRARASLSVAEHKTNPSIKVGFEPYMQLHASLKLLLLKSANLVDDVKNIMQTGELNSASVLELALCKACKGDVEPMLEGVTRTAATSIKSLNDARLMVDHPGAQHNYTFVVLLKLTNKALLNVGVKQSVLPIMSLNLKAI